MMRVAIADGKTVGDHVEDITFIHNDFIYHLEISSSYHCDFSPLRGNLTITFLSLSYCNITNIDFLKGNNTITSLNLRRNAISSIEPLRGNTSITHLNLDGNMLKDISSVLKSILGMVWCKISSNELQDMEFVRDNSYITYLNIRDAGMNIKDFSPLEGNNTLSYLNLTGCRIDDINFLKGGKYTTLKIRRNNIKTIEPLRNNPHIETLHISENEMRDVSCLDGCENLRCLKIEHRRNHLIDLRQLCSNYSLTQIYISEMQYRYLGEYTPEEDAYQKGLHCVRNLCYYNRMNSRNRYTTYHDILYTSVLKSQGKLNLLSGIFDCNLIFY